MRLASQSNTLAPPGCFLSSFSLLLLLLLLSFCLSLANVEYRRDQEHNAKGDYCSLHSEDSGYTVFLDPAGLEIAHREPTSGAPDVEDGCDNGGVFGVLLKGECCDCTEVVSLVIRVCRPWTYTLAPLKPATTIAQPKARPIQLFW